jgi:hypothetical protein
MIKKENPYEESVLKECAVCGKSATVDQFGQGPCKSCSWYQNELGDDNLDRVIFPNLVSLNKARRLYSEGKPFFPSLEDFVEGMFFYNDMTFDLDNRSFCASVHDEDGVIFGYSPESTQIYKTKEEFIAKAHVDGVLLKDIWHKIENPYYN